MEVGKDELTNVFIRKQDIDFYSIKEKVVLINMKNGKCWVCDKSTDLNQDAEFIKIILPPKDKCDCNGYKKKY